MLVSQLYEALDALEEDARSTAEDFAETGDLAELAKRLGSIGDRSWGLNAAVNGVMNALKEALS